jgi:hypothetical protein
VKVTIEVSDFTAEWLAKRGPLAEVISALADAEAKRLWHVERCRPKPPEERRPVGRPKVAAKTKKVRELGEQLRGIYLKLQELYGARFEELYGAQERQLEQAIAGEDLQTLIWFLDQQPWVKR